VELKERGAPTWEKPAREEVAPPLPASDPLPVREEKPVREEAEEASSSPAPPRSRIARPRRGAGGWERASIMRYLHRLGS
jgi:hypothetical protein